VCAHDLLALAALDRHAELAGRQQALDAAVHLQLGGGPGAELHRHACAGRAKASGARPCEGRVRAWSAGVRRP
jgi:hypothetical protein